MKNESIIREELKKSHDLFHKALAKNDDHAAALWSMYIRGIEFVLDEKSV